MTEKTKAEVTNDKRRTILCEWESEIERLTKKEKNGRFLGVHMSSLAKYGALMTGVKSVVDLANQGVSFDSAMSFAAGGFFYYLGRNWERHYKEIYDSLKRKQLRSDIWMQEELESRDAYWTLDRTNHKD